MASMMIDVTDETFEQEVLNSELPVVVDFWAEWCAPCKQLTPVLEQLAAEFEGKARFVKFDTDSGHKTPEQYGIRALPTVVIFKNGKPKDEFRGFRPKPEVKKIISNAV